MSNQFSRTTLILLAIILLALAVPTMAQHRRVSANAFAPQSSTESATAVFRAARDLITDGEWAKAQDKFSEYVSKFPNEKNLDAALYWLAYSQYKLGRYQQCRETSNKLFEKYQNSAWLDDARLLLAQIPGAIVTSSPAAVAVRPLPADQLFVDPTTITPLTPGVTNLYAPSGPITAIGTTMPAQIAGSAYLADLDALAIGISESNDDDPCEFKIVVLQALFQTDVQRGILAATEWLKPGSTQTVRCKGAALALLARHGGKASTPVILGLARSEPDVKLRARAISTLGATNDDSVVDALRDFAMSSQDNSIVEASLYALSKHTGERAITVLGEFAANNSRTIPQRRVAIASIASRPGEPAVG